MKPIARFTSLIFPSQLLMLLQDKPDTSPADSNHELPSLTGRPGEMIWQNLNQTS